MAKTTENIDLEGSLNRYKGKSEDRSKMYSLPRWVILREGSLHCYKTPSDLEPMETLDLLNATLDTTNYQFNSPYCFSLTSEKSSIILSTITPEDYTHWMGGIRKNLSKKPSSPPKRVKLVKDTGVAYKTKKALGEKFITTNLGKSILKDFVSTETWEIMESTRSFMSKMSGEKFAEELYNNTLKFLIKCALLCKERIISYDKFWDVAYKPLLLLISQLIDGKELSFTLDPDAIAHSVMNLDLITAEVFNPYFSSKTMKEFDKVMSYLGNRDLWFQLYTNPIYRTEITCIVKNLRAIWELWHQAPSANTNSLIISTSPNKS